MRHDDQVIVVRGKYVGLKGRVVGNPYHGKVGVNLDHPVHRILGPAVLDAKNVVVIKASGDYRPLARAVPRGGDGRRRSGSAPPQSLHIRGRDYRVEMAPTDKEEWPEAEKRVRYLLHGVRGAAYTTMRSVPQPDVMFLLDAKRGRIASVMDGVWLSDKDGVLRVLSQ